MNIYPYSTSFFFRSPGLIFIKISLTHQNRCTGLVVITDQQMKSIIMKKIVCISQHIPTCSVHIFYLHSLFFHLDCIFAIVVGCTVLRYFILITSLLLPIGSNDQWDEHVLCSCSDMLSGA
jgi:hypothetical protein